MKPPTQHPIPTLVLAALLAGPALAQAPRADAGAQPPAAPTTTPAPAATDATDATAAEVRKVDKAAGKITLRHEPIKNLDMPAMTMVFQVRDRAALDTVKAGDKVRFKAVEEAGKYVVTEIRAHE